jgi:hypothetical protein
MNSPESYQIIPMNVPTPPSGASSLPEKRLIAGRYFNCGTSQALRSIGHAQLL